MDVSVTLGIPVAAVFLGANAVLNFMRYKEMRNGNGNKCAVYSDTGERNSIIKDIKEGQKACVACFVKIGESSARQETHLQNIVIQLQLLNSRQTQ